MKAITVRQPWASLIILGRKRIETRSWRTHFRGELAIHAGGAVPCKIGERFRVGAFEVERDRGGLLLRSKSLSHPYRLPLGAIVGTAELYEVRSTNSPEFAPPPEEEPYGDYSRDRFGWYMTALSRGTVSCPGRLGLWDVPDDIAAKFEADATRFYGPKR